MDFYDWSKLQEELQEVAFGVNPRDIEDPEQRAEFIRWNALAAVDEIMEMLNETGWKPWSKRRFVNTDAVCEEGVDVMHFLMNIFLAAGVSPGQISETYRKKVQTNIRRQKEGY